MTTDLMRCLTEEHLGMASLRIKFTIEQIGAEVHLGYSVTHNGIRDQTEISESPMVVMKVVDGPIIEITKANQTLVVAMMRGDPPEISTILHPMVEIMVEDGPTIVITKGIHSSVDAIKRGVMMMVKDGPSMEVNKAIRP